MSITAITTGELAPRKEEGRLYVSLQGTSADIEGLKGLEGKRAAMIVAQEQGLDRCGLSGHSGTFLLPKSKAKDAEQLYGITYAVTRSIGL